MIVHLRVGYGIFFKYPVGTDVYVVYTVYFLFGSQCSVIGEATWLWDDDLGIVFRLPAFANISLFPKHPNCFWVPHVLLFYGYRGRFFWCAAAELGRLLQSRTEVKNVLCCPLMACIRAILRSHLLCIFKLVFIQTHITIRTTAVFDNFISMWSGFIHRVLAVGDVWDFILCLLLRTRMYGFLFLYCNVSCYVLLHH